MRFIQGNNREQIEMMSLDGFVEQESIVRYIDALVDEAFPALFDSLDVSELPEHNSSKLGRKGYNPATMLKLLIYGCAIGVTSSRKLEQECYRNVEMKWLTSDLKPDHKTISNYRKHYGFLMNRMFEWYNRKLKEEGFISGKLIALDGTKIKGNASRLKKVRYDKVKSELDRTIGELNRYLEVLEQNDRIEQLDWTETNNDDDNPPSGIVTMQDLRDKIGKYQERIKELQGQMEDMEDRNQSYLNLTDPDTMTVKTRDGKVDGFNAHVSADAEAHMITSVVLHENTNDFHGIPGTLDHLSKTLGLTPEALAADMGFADPKILKAVEEAGGTELIVPLLPSQRRDAQDFRYDADADCFICKMGKKLAYTGGRDVYKGVPRYKYQCKDCLGCPQRSKCTRSKVGRIVYRFENDVWRERYRERQSSPEQRKLYNKRKGLIENVFGTLKMWMGKIPLQMRGIKDVLQEMNLWCLIYNMKRYWKLKKSGPLCPKSAKMRENAVFFCFFLSF